jgi:tryptophan synthase alpha chain
MNRICERFDRLVEKKEKGFVAYIGAGDPNLDLTRELTLAFDRVGVDVVELGVPFSDPLADGPVNQLAAQRGLESGTTLEGVFGAVSEIRKLSQVPIVLYIYYNLVHKRGLDRFVKDAASAGVDGLLVLDLPPEEGASYETAMEAAGLCNIYLIAPTTPGERMAYIVPRARGFIYYISREGVTGMQEKVSDTIQEMTSRIHEYSDLPVAVGFGISNPDQARQVAVDADAVVVGSAIVNRIAEIGNQPNLVPDVSGFVKTLVDAVKELK